MTSRSFAGCDNPVTGCLCELWLSIAEAAVKDARRNAALNGITNATFIVGNLEDGLKDPAKKSAGQNQGGDEAPSNKAAAKQVRECMGEGWKCVHTCLLSSPQQACCLEAAAWHVIYATYGIDLPRLHSSDWFAECCCLCNRSSTCRHGCPLM
jgi:hypothetical protein